MNQYDHKFMRGLRIAIDDSPANAQLAEEIEVLEIQLLVANQWRRRWRLRCAIASGLFGVSILAISAMIAGRL